MRMVGDHMSTYGSLPSIADAVGPQLGISGNTLRRARRDHPNTAPARTAQRPFQSARC